MTAAELREMAERYTVGESTIEDDADMIRVLRAVAKLEDMVRRDQSIRFWDCTSGAVMIERDDFRYQVTGKTVLEAIENYKEQS